MAYTRKTRDYWSIEQYTGGQYGWEEVSAADTWKEAKQTVREYRENQPEYPARVRRRRERIESEVANRAGYVQDVGIEIGGCGMDVGFEVVYNLGRVLWPKGFICSGEKCQSNDHSNDPKCRRDTFVGQMHTGDGGYALRHEWI